MSMKLPRRRVLELLAAAAFAVFTTPMPLAAADAPRAADVGVVSHVSVLSDKAQDVSSIDAWRKSFIKPGMTEKEKAIAVWQSMVMFRHQANPPNEYCGVENTPCDPIRTFNVYGYNMCNGASAGVIQLARHAGLEARGWAITSHSVAEIKVDGKWGLFDTSLINYFERPDGTIVGVEEISKTCDEWLQKHPE